MIFRILYQNHCNIIQVKQDKQITLLLQIGEYAGVLVRRFISRYLWTFMQRAVVKLAHPSSGSVKIESYIHRLTLFDNSFAFRTLCNTENKLFV